MMKPYLKPQETLLDFSVFASESEESKSDGIFKRKLIRLKDPIRFNIEPMPLKVKFRVQKDENKDQALLGDFHNVYFFFEPEDITLTEMSVIVEGVSHEASSHGQDMLSGSIQLENQNLMVSQVLDDSKTLASSSLNQSSVSSNQSV